MKIPKQVLIWIVIRRGAFSFFTEQDFQLLFQQNICINKSKLNLIIIKIQLKIDPWVDPDALILVLMCKNEAMSSNFISINAFLKASQALQTFNYYDILNMRKVAVNCRGKEELTQIREEEDSWHKSENKTRVRRKRRGEWVTGWQIWRGIVTHCGVCCPPPAPIPPSTAPPPAGRGLCWCPASPVQDWDLLRERLRGGGEIGGSKERTPGEDDEDEWLREAREE